MNTVKKKLASAVMALLLVLSMCTNAMAAAPGADLRLESVADNGQITVTVYLTGEGITNGRVAVSYDAALELVSAAVADENWMVSVNRETAGQAYFAWVGSDLPAEETLVLTLVFEVIEDVSSVNITANAMELYTAHAALSASSVNDSMTVVLREETGGDDPVPPIIPVPTPPEIPTEPEGGGSDPEPGVTDPECPFTDIADHWGEEYIVAAWKAGLINGTTETTYSPDMPLTRGMFATLLYRLAGSPEVTAENPFTDVGDMYYTNPIIWAYNNGIVKGVSDTEFRPNNNITRQELVTMLLRYAKFTGSYVAGSADLSSFTDAASVADWAQEAMEWAVSEGVVIGSGSKLSPKVNTSRAETATILVRYAGL